MLWTLLLLMLWRPLFKSELRTVYISDDNTLNLTRSTGADSDVVVFVVVGDVGVHCLDLSYVQFT